MRNSPLIPVSPRTQENGGVVCSVFIISLLSSYCVPGSVLSSLRAVSHGSSSGPSQRNRVIEDSLRKGLFTELRAASKESTGVVIAHGLGSD